MANRAREDDKNERIIRNLLKLPENRRCINCNSLGPQYVCTNFSTFICTTCSGIHREFTHRVKSVSMAKFTPLEVSALQGGGMRAREIYLKEWDPQRNSLPDGRNVQRLRDFIKHVYVDRRFTGERILDKAPRDKMGETEGFNGSRGVETLQSGSRSPSYDNRSEQRRADQLSSGGRSPENWQSRDYRKTPGNAEVVNDWRREDGFGNGRRSGERSSDDEHKSDARSPNHLKDPEFPSSPEVRPVRDILGENVLPLRVIEPPNAASGKPTDGSLRPQRNTSSSSIASSDGNPSEIKADAPFIDFDSPPVPASTVTGPQIQHPAANEPPIQHTTSNSNDWANFDSMTGAKVQSTSSNSLESMLSGFPISTSKSASPGLPDMSSVASYGSTNAPSVLPPVVNPSSVAPQPQFINVQQNAVISASRPQNPVLPGYNGQPLPQTVAPATALYSSNKALNPLAQMVQEPPRPSVFPGATYEVNSTMGNSLGSAQGSSQESKSSGRQALPEGLFSMNYAYGPSPASGWYPTPGAPYMAGMPPQYSIPVPPMHAYNYPAPARSINPFEVGNESSQPQASTFPSMASLQGALPRMATPGILRAPGHGLPPQHTAMPIFSQAPIYPSPIIQGSFMGRDASGARPQVPSGFGAEASPNPNLHPAHSASSSFTPTGNPFG